MGKTLVYGVAGCFLATMLAVYLNKTASNFLLLLLMPMWGLVLGISTGRVASSRIEEPQPVEEEKPKEVVLYSAKKKKK